ncbi:MAG: MFS transporter, partial [Pseudomonadota bacterium]
MAAASGALVLVNGVGAMLGPVVTGVLMEPSRLGPNGWWVFLTVVFALMAAYGLYRATQRPTVAIEETGP